MGADFRSPSSLAGGARTWPVSSEHLTMLSLSLNSSASSSSDFSNADIAHMFHDLGVPVLDIFPMSNWDNNHVLVIALVYAVLFMVGICGNVSVITLIRHVHTDVAYENTMIYVLFLCCVDFISMMPLPMTIVDQLLGFWMFGTTLCKLYRLLEHVGKILSTFVLAAMAFDRCVGVCYPHNAPGRSRMAVTTLLVTLSLVTLILLAPLLFFAASEEIVLHQAVLEDPLRLARVRIYKCVDNLEGTVFKVFTLYIFTLGFAIPIALIVIFYGIMLRRLFMRSRRLPNSQVPVNRIAVYTMAIALFYVACWAPYWVAMLYSLHLEMTGSKSPSAFISPTFVYIMYGVHALPYVNSAANWLFYGMLNRQLHRRAATRKITSGSTHLRNGRQTSPVTQSTGDNRIFAKMSPSDSGHNRLINDESSVRKYYSLCMDSAL